jgi:hypothetical protein
MEKASEFREYADQCRALARRAQSSEDRQKLLHMAATWDSVADVRERGLANREIRNVD